MKSLSTLALCLTVGCMSIHREPEVENYRHRLPNPPLQYQSITISSLGALLPDLKSPAFSRWTVPTPGYRLMNSTTTAVDVVGWYWTVELSSQVGTSRSGFTIYEFLLDENNQLWWSPDGGPTALRPFSRPYAEAPVIAPDSAVARITELDQSSLGVERASSESATGGR